MTGRIRSGFVSVGSPRHAAEQGELPRAVRRRIEALEGDGTTVVVVSEGKRPLGLIALRDEPRPDSVEGLARLRGQRRRVIDAVADHGDRRPGLVGRERFEFRVRQQLGLLFDAERGGNRRGGVGVVARQLSGDIGA